MELHKIQENNLSATITTIGATITSIVLGSKHILRPVENPGNDPTFPNAIMAPFMSRVVDGKYTFEGIEYQLEINQPEHGNALHGLFYNREFEVNVNETTENSITLVNTINSNEFEGYPFDLKLEVKYMLQEDGLDVVTTATNTGKTNLPYAIGWHPYYLPQSADKVDDCNIQIPFREMSTQENKNILLSEIDFLDNNVNGLIGTAELDTTFTDPETANEEEKIMTRFGNYEIYQGSSMKVLQVYIPEDRKSIAIESQTAIPNSFNNGYGLITLEPTHSIQHNFGFKIIQ